MTIKNKLISVAISIVVAMIILTALLNFSLDRLDSLRDTSSLATSIQINMLTLRRHEKDFLARRAPKYHAAFMETSASMKKDLAGLHTALADAGSEYEENLAKVTSLSQDLEVYDTKFKSLFELQKTIGLDEKSGLNGSLRQAVHAVESLIRETGDHQLLATMLMLRRNEKDFMLRQNLKYQAKFNSNYKALLSTLSSSSIPGAQQQQIQKTIKQYQSDFYTLIKFSQQKGLSSKEGLLGELRGAVHQAEDNLQTLTVELSEKLVSSRSTLKSTVITTALVLALVIVSAIVFVMRSVVRQLQLLDARMLDIAEGDGDLTKTMDTSGNDEISRVGVSFNRFIGKIHDVISKMRLASQRLATATEQLGQSSKQSLSIMHQLKDETGQVATAVTELAATGEEVARNVVHAADAARDSDTEAQHGYDVVSRTRDSITGLASEVHKASTVVSQLDTDTQNIGGILDVIRGIADQTNLLALNAAIEAARAGEQGRGFAVVADEVRTLAQKSQESTEEIQRMIEQVQEGAANAVQAMKSGQELAEKSVAEAGVAGDSLESITRSASTISDINTQIASAAEEQVSVTSEVNRNITNISQATEETTQHASDVASAAGELAELMADINRLVELFRIAS